MTTTRKCVICGDIFAVREGNVLPPHDCTDPQTKRRNRTARRDAFAAAALTGLLLHASRADWSANVSRDDLAVEAWRQADAMLDAEGR